MKRHRILVWGAVAGMVWVAMADGAPLCTGQADPAHQLACYEGVIQGIGLYDPARADDLMDGCKAVGDRLACLELVLDPPSNVHSSRKNVSHWRLEAGLGYTHGRHDGTFDLADGPLRLTSLLGGAGMVKRLALFSPSSHAGWGWGLEYVGLNNSSRARLLMPKGVSILTDPVQGGATLQAEADLLFVELLRSFPTSLGLEPYMGVGVGAGYGRATADYTLQTAMIAPIRQHLESSSWIPALQAMGGVRMDLWESGFLTLGGRLLYATGRPFGLDHQYLNLSLDGGVGARF